MTPPDLARLSRYVRTRRGDLGMTQEDLARAAGVDPKTIYNVESGTHKPYAKNASRIERALRWSSGALEIIASGGEPSDLDAGTVLRLLRPADASESNGG